MLTAEEFKNTNWKITYEEYCKCHCPSCKNKCIHENAFRRLPEVTGGLGLCPNLKTK